VHMHQHWATAQQTAVSLGEVSSESLIHVCACQY
jgi:hypothetical protein